MIENKFLQFSAIVLIIVIIPLVEHLLFYHDHELDLIELNHVLDQHELYSDNLQKALYCLRVSPLQRPKISKMLIYDDNCIINDS